jgi:RNA polymerase sigma-70 factor (ECF subfamily)
MPGLRGTSDRRLLLAARRGDGDAFAIFYRRYGDLVLAYFIRRVRGPELAADLMMEVFAAALSETQKADWRAPGDGGRWLFGIAHNKLVDSYRHKTAEQRARTALRLEPVELDDQDIERINELTSEEGVLLRLAALPRDQREAIRAHILEEQSYDEIAEDLGTSSMVVRKRVSRGLRHLREAGGRT